jgi:hypothetical protein
VFSVDLNYFSFVARFSLVCAAIRSIWFFLLGESLVRARWAPTKFLIEFVQLVLLKIRFSFPFSTQIFSFRAQKLMPPVLLWFGSRGPRSLRLVKRAGDFSFLWPDSSQFNASDFWFLLLPSRSAL